MRNAVNVKNKINTRSLVLKNAWSNPVQNAVQTMKTCSLTSILKFKKTNQKTNMNPLKTNRRVLTWLCGIPPNETATKRERFAHIACTSLVIAGNFSVFLAGAVFIWQNFSNNLEASLYSLMHTVASFNILYHSILAIFMRHKMGKIFENLSTIYIECEWNHLKFLDEKKNDTNFNSNLDKNDDDLPMLINTNETCEWIWKIFMKYIFCGGLASNIIIPVVSILLCYILNGHFSVDELYHPLRLTYVFVWFN